MDSCPVQGESHTLIRLSRSTLRKLEISSGLMSQSGSSGKDLGFFYCEWLNFFLKFMTHQRFLRQVTRAQTLKKMNKDFDLCEVS